MGNGKLGNGNPGNEKLGIVYRACKLLKFVSMVSMFLTISGGKQKNCCNGA